MRAVGSKQGKALGVAAVSAGLLGLAVLVPAVGGCRHSPPWVGGKPAALRVGIAPIYPPIAFKENGEIKGVEADFAQQLSKDLKLKVSVVELPWDELIPALTGNRIDVIMSGMSVTEERSKLVSFTQPYLRVGQMALIRKADYARLHDYNTMTLPHTRIGFQTGTTGEAFVRDKLTHAKLKGFDSPEAGIEALRRNEIDFFVHDAPTIWRTTGGLERKDAELMGRYRPLTEEYLAWAVRKQDNALREQLNVMVLRWQKSGQLEAVLDRWITVRKMTVEVKPAH